MDVEGTECDDVGEETSCSIEKCDGTQVCMPDKFWGSCECEDLGTGGEDGGSGGDMSTGGSNATGGNDSTGGRDNTGGVGGDIDTGGTMNTGGDVSTGGVSTGGIMNTGGMNNTGGTGGETCVPKTCDEYSIEMAGEAGFACLGGESIDDGCGGILECDVACPDNTKCDGDQFPTESPEGINGFATITDYAGSQTTAFGPRIGTSNICSGGCVTWPADECPAVGTGEEEWRGVRSCTLSPDDEDPQPDTLILDGFDEVLRINESDTLLHHWCYR